jgi:gamma-glutamylcyclotransferase (GGCT)/AIG2-like uncharacterized protein YtfP
VTGILTPTVEIFVYGTLQPGLQSLVAILKSERDCVLGKLFSLGSYPILQLGHATLVPGYRITINSSNLAILDHYEDLASGEYERCSVTTQAGKRVFVYVSGAKADLTAGQPIQSWPAR